MPPSSSIGTGSWSGTKIRRYGPHRFTENSPARSAVRAWQLPGTPCMSLRVGAAVSASSRRRSRDQFCFPKRRRPALSLEQCFSNLRSDQAISIAGTP